MFVIFIMFFLLLLLLLLRVERMFESSRALLLLQLEDKLGVKHAQSNEEHEEF